jgi:RNA methyltransferase, TrmH family
LIIRSTANNRVKKIRDQIREGWPDSHGRVLVEGIKLIEEALKSRLDVDSFYVSEQTRKIGLLEGLLKGSKTSQPVVIQLSEKVFSEISSTETPQGVSALVFLPKWSLERILTKDSLLIFAHCLQDPGNLGTLLRSAEAFGADAIILSKNSVNPYNSKAIRASAGSVFRVPCFPGWDPQETLALFDRNNYRVYATGPGRGLGFRDIDYRGRVALILGNEARGLDGPILDQVESQITIPISSSVESLNVAVASSIILCQAAEQRRAPKRQ